MSPKTKVNISPPDLFKPQTACLPVEKARRWNSSFDDDINLTPVVSVFLTQPAYSRICMHAASDLDQEVGGFLVGQWCSDEESGRQFIVVDNVSPARHTRQGSVYLTFTQDSLVQIHDEIDEHYQGKRIVGWYHTHPRMGIFLSHYDTWLHNNFFPEPWQVALVVEPHASLGGFFIRQQDGRLDPGRYFGFYEVDGSFGRSMVKWNNLIQPVEEEGDKPV
jgi:proteasome lid subunit RPN8/RPN11